MKYIKLFEEFSNLTGTSTYTDISDNKKDELKKFVFDLFSQCHTEKADGSKKYNFEHGNGDIGSFLPPKDSMLYLGKDNEVEFWDDIDVTFGKKTPESTFYIISKKIRINGESPDYIRELCGEAALEIHNRKVDNVAYQA